MNVRACSSQKVQGIAGGKGAVAARAKGMGTGTELPDFAAFLGMALSLGDLEQQLGQGAMGQAAASDGKAAKAGTACGPVAIFSDPAKTDQSKCDDSTANLAAALGLGAQGLPVKPQVAQGTATEQATSNQSPLMGGQTAAVAIPQAVVNPATPGEAAATQDGAAAAETDTGKITREWNVQDLAHQLRAAIGHVSTGSEQQEKAAVTPTHTTLTAAKGQGEKIHAAATTTPGRTAAAGKGQGAQVKTEQPGLAIQPPSPNPGAKNAGQPFYAADPRFKAQVVADVAASAAEKKAPALDSDTAEDPTAAAAGSAPLTWTPEPVASAEHNETRMPGMIEQVRQVADFLAERTEGVIRMGDKGVEANLKLYPPDLGGVRVQLTVNSDRTTQAQFIVERPETAQLLQQHMRSFQQGLESHGLTIDKVQVTVQGTVRPASSAGAESGWRQNSSQDFRRENAQTNQREGQQSRRGGRGTQQEFEG